jgi:hypothetical protein
MTLAAQPDIDLTGSAVIACPYLPYRSLREFGPVVEVRGTVHVTTYEPADSVPKNSVFGCGEPCLGATPARVEAEIALASLARSFPRQSSAGSDIRYPPNVILRGLEDLVGRTT